MPSEFLSHAPRGAATVLSGVMVASAAMWGVSMPPSQIQATTVLGANNAPQTIDLSSSTVQDIIAGQYDTDRFYLLLTDTDTFSQLNGPGPYVVYAPKNSAFDYLPRDQYVNLSADQKKALAEAQLGPVPLPADIEVVKEYEASNGVVYLITQVLPVLSTPTPQ